MKEYTKNNNGIYNALKNNSMSHFHTSEGSKMDTETPIKLSKYNRNFEST